MNKTKYDAFDWSLVAVAALIVAACVLAFVGCTSTTSIEWGGKTALRASDGSVVLNKDGVPYYESAPNKYRDFNMLTRREERGVSVSAKADGSYEASLESRVNDVSTNGVVMAHNLVTDFALLAEKAAAAYATAGASVAAAGVKKAIASYILKGGNASKTNVTCENGNCTFTDGVVTETCIGCSEM